MTTNPWTDGVLGDGIVRVLGGGTPSRSNPAYWGGSIPWASVKDFQDGELALTRTEESITPAGLAGSASNLIPAGTPIVCTRMAVGRVASSWVDVAINQDLKALFLNNNRLHHRFALRLLDHLKPRLEALAVGSTVKGIDLGTMLGLPVRFPGLPEQARIAEVLDTLDEAIQRTVKILNKLQKAGEGLSDDLLARVAGKTNGRTLHTVGDLLRLGLLKDVQDGNHGELHPKRSDFVPEGIPFVMAKDILNGFVDFIGCYKISYEQYRRLRIGHSRAGDVLLSHKGTIGATAIVPDSLPDLMLTPQVTYYRVGQPTKLLPDFLLRWFRGSKFQRELFLLGAQSTRDYVGLTLQKSLPVPIPTIQEQQQVVEAIESHEAIWALESARLNKMLALKTGITSDLLTGRVRTHQS